MKDKKKEEELRRSSYAKYQHLKEDLHVEITAFDRPAEAYRNISIALTKIHACLIPVPNDNIKQMQMKELDLMSQIHHTLHTQQTPVFLHSPFLMESSQTPVLFPTPPPEVEVSPGDEVLTESKLKLITRKEHVKLRREKSDPY